MQIRIIALDESQFWNPEMLRRTGGKIWSVSLRTPRAPNLQRRNRLMPKSACQGFSGHETATSITTNSVTYHQTEVFRVNGDGTVTIDTGGYETATTTRRINQAAHHFGFQLHAYRKNHSLHIDFVEPFQSLLGPTLRTVEYAGATEPLTLVVAKDNGINYSEVSR